jgi:hypothetical protein
MNLDPRGIRTNTYYQLAVRSAFPSDTASENSAFRRIRRSSVAQTGSGYTNHTVVSEMSQAQK